MATCLLIYFVLTLREGTARKQFKLLAWNLMSCLVATNLMLYAADTTIEGQLWFTLPALLIAINDIFAYFVGYFLGRHQLIAISPKKTWEGYIGSSFLTLIFVFYLSRFFEGIPGITCRLRNPTLMPFYVDTC